MNTTQQPDWATSETSPTEMWKNPLYPMHVRLEMADGAIHHRDQSIKKLGAYIDQLTEMNNELIEALKIAKQFMQVASDWNLDEVELNGEMRDTHDVIDLIQSVINKGEGK